MGIKTELYTIQTQNKIQKFTNCTSNEHTKAKLHLDMVIASVYTFIQEHRDDCIHSQT